MNTEHTNPILQTILGLDLRTWRSDQHMTQRDLAKRLGVRHETVCRWEAGVDAPSAQHLAQLLALVYSAPEAA